MSPHKRRLRLTKGWIAQALPQSWSLALSGADMQMDSNKCHAHVPVAHAVLGARLARRSIRGAPALTTAPRGPQWCGRLTLERQPTTRKLRPQPLNCRRWLERRRQLSDSAPLQHPSIRVVAIVEDLWMGQRF